MPTPIPTIIPTSRGRSFVKATPHHVTWTNFETYVRIHTPQNVVGTWTVENMGGPLRTSWIAAIVAGTCGTLNGARIGDPDETNVPAGLADDWTMNGATGPVGRQDSQWLSVALCTDPVRPILTGVHVDPDSSTGCTVVATDSYRLHTLADKADTFRGWSGLIVPAPTFDACTMLADVHVGTVDGVGHTPFPMATGWTSTGVRIDVVGRPIDGKYPPYRNLMPKDATTRFAVESATLRAVADAAAGWVKRAGKDLATPVRMCVGTGTGDTYGTTGVSLTVRVQDVGAAWSTVPGADTVHPGAVAFNPKFLASTVAHCDGALTTVAGVDALKPWTFKTGPRTALLMPVRVDGDGVRSTSIAQPDDCGVLDVKWPRGVTPTPVYVPTWTSTVDPAPVADPVTPCPAPTVAKVKTPRAPRAIRVKSPGYAPAPTSSHPDIDAPTPVADVPTVDPAPVTPTPPADPAPVETVDVPTPTPVADVTPAERCTVDVDTLADVIVALRAELAELRAAIVDRAPTVPTWTPVTPAETPTPVADPDPVDYSPITTDWTDRAPVATMTRPVHAKAVEYLDRLASPAKRAYAQSLVDAWRAGCAPVLNQANVWAADVEAKLARYGVTFP